MHPPQGRSRNLLLEMEIDFDAYRQGDVDAPIEAWLPLTYTVDSLAHGRGQPAL